jgi:hypothetical protein
VSRLQVRASIASEYNTLFPGVLTHMDKAPATKRARAVKRLKDYLLRHGQPRAEMTLMVLATGLSGFAFSFFLLKLGLHAMWLRYVLSILLAYGVFLLLVRLWLAFQHRRHERRTRLRPGVDLTGSDLADPNLVDLIPGRSTGRAPDIVPGGGRFGGGGAGGEFQQMQLAAAAQPDPPAKGFGFGGGIDLNLDGDEWLVVLALIAAIGATICASAYVIVTAPALLAEVLLDGALCAGLHRRLRRIEQQSWLEAAIKHTWIPVLVVAVFFALAGLAMHHYVPEARSIGGVWNHFLHQHPA